MVVSLQTRRGCKGAMVSRKGSYKDKESEGIPELLRGLNFSISRDGPDMYLKAVKRLV